jgi:acetyl esterase/lipase
MSSLANIAQSIFKKMQDNTAGSKKMLLKYCHMPQLVLPSPAILKRVHVVSERLNGVEYFVVTGKIKKPGNRAVIFMHGGGFVFQISPQH